MDTEHDLITALRHISVGGYEFDVFFKNVRDKATGTIWPVIEVDNITEPGMEHLEGQYLFDFDGNIMQVL